MISKIHLNLKFYNYVIFGQGGKISPTNLSGIALWPGRQVAASSPRKKDVLVSLTMPTSSATVSVSVDLIMTFGEDLPLGLHRSAATHPVCRQIL